MPKANNTTQYYDETASKYDALHGDQHNTGHMEALELIVPRHFPNITSVLDVGAGTGRAISWFDRILNAEGHKVDLVGLEPSAKMRDVAVQKVPTASFVEGYGDAIPFEDGAFDLVTITGVLHHVENPKAVIRECFRVSRVGVLISDHNNFSFGSTFARKLRLGLYSIGLLSAFRYMKQGFKKQGYSEDDGWWYPYSVLHDFDVISELSSYSAVIPTRRANSNLGNFILQNSHVGIACLK